MKKHEQFIADKFFEYFTAVRAGAMLPPSKMALDGQDAILGADYLINNDTKFALIEFKFGEKDIKTEMKKPLRGELCKALSKDEITRYLHGRCHYISFFASENILLSVYSDEVCCSSVFSSDQCHVELSGTFEGDRINHAQFTNHFAKANSEIGLSPIEFQIYVDKLCEIAGESSSSIELVAMNPDVETIELLTFNSIRDLHEWYMDIYIPALQAKLATPSHKKHSSGPSGPSGP